MSVFASKMLSHTFFNTFFVIGFLNVTNVTQITEIKETTAIRGRSLMRPFCFFISFESDL